MTDSMSLADVFSRDEILGLGFDYYSKYGSILSSITFNEIIEAAKEYMIPDKKYVVGVSSPNSSELTIEDKKLIIKQPKKEDTSNKEPNKDSGKDSNKDSGKDNKTTNNNSKK